MIIKPDKDHSIIPRSQTPSTHQTKPHPPISSQSGPPHVPSLSSTPTFCSLYSMYLQCQNLCLALGRKDGCPYLQQANLGTYPLQPPMAEPVAEAP